MWLVSLANHLTSGRALPADLLSDIDNFKDMTTEKLNSPPASKKFDASSATQTAAMPLTATSASPSTNKSDLIYKKSAQCKPEAIIESHSNGRETPDVCDAECDSLSVSNNSKLYSNNCSISRNGKRYAGVSLKDMCTSSPSMDDADHVDGVALLKKPTTDAPQIGSMIRDIPKSPHLSKDFSPNGERLRNSIRARRQERMAKQRSMRTMANCFVTQQSTCSSDAGSETSGLNLDDAEEFGGFSPRVATFGRVNELKPTSQRRRSRPYGDKGFIINVNDGLLTINDVKDLNNCCSDDFDSSCDTSLNYIDCNSSNSTISMVADTENTSLKNILIDMMIQPTPAVAPSNESEEMLKVNKITLDELRDEMHKCKSKLDALKLGDNSTSNWKQMSPLNGSKVSLNDMPKVSSESVNSKLITHPIVHEKKPHLTISSSSPYARLNPLSSPILNSRATAATPARPKMVRQPNRSESHTADTAKKFSTKRNAVASTPKHNNKCNNKNLTNNSTILIERIGSSVNDATTKFDPKTNAQKKTNEFPTEKLNNKINFGKNHSYMNRMYMAEGTSNELFGRKPPAAVSGANKKRDGIKPSLKTNEKMPATKNKPSLATSATRKIL